MNKETSTRAHTTVGIALPVNLSGQKANWLTANAPTVAEKSTWQRKKHTSSR